MTKRHRHLLLLLAAGFATLIWATLPPDEIALTDSCTPISGPAQMSALLYPGPFWRHQSAALDAELTDLQAYPARRARLEAEAARQTAAGIEGKMERLSREQEDDPDLKERRDAERKAARLRRMIWLADCSAQIQKRLAQ